MVARAADPADARMTTVAVVGLGGMGARLARRLLEAGHEVVVWNRSRERTARLTDLGAVPATSPADAARRGEALITMVADPSALQAVTEGATGVSAGAGGGVTVVEMSTVGPAAISRLRSVLPPQAGLIDAPVLGSLSEAESGSLRIFVGGPEPLVERWNPLLSALGSPLHVGPLGTGAGAKLIANTTLFAALAGLGEALALAQGLALPRDVAFQVLAVTPLAAQAERRRPSIETGEYPSRFSLSLARKDAELIAKAAEASGVDLRLAAAARTWIEEAEDGGWGDRDYAAVLDWILGSR